MSVLLFGSETWSLAPGTLKRLDGFHHRAAWRMAGMRPSHDGEGNWTYPKNTRALKKVGMYTIEHYICVRRHTISDYIVHWPIFEHCWNGVRQRSSSPRMFWWDQPMHLDKEAPDSASDSNIDSDAGEEQAFLLEANDGLLLYSSINSYEQQRLTALRALACGLKPCRGKDPASRRPSQHTHTRRNW